MRSKVYTFESDSVIVHWDYHRCIHVEACIRTLPTVFDRHNRPWIDPTQATAEEVAEACEACPTGALHYERKDGGRAEATPTENTIIVTSDGPLFVKGDVRVTDAEGETILQDTRVALCRCGHSKNKPLCDNGHLKAEFKAEGALDETRVQESRGGSSEGGELVIRTSDPGPLTIKGSAEIRGDTANDCCVVRVGALCCCGKSKNKPFCDGSHAEA